MSNAARWLAAATCVFGATGCGIRYTATADAQMEAYAHFNGKGPISLQNVQPSVEKHRIVARWYTDRKHCTDVAIEIIQRELSQRGMAVSGNAGKSLKVSVESLKGDIGFVQSEALATLKVETGSGYAGTYVGRNTSYVMINWPRQLNGALMRAVNQMLGDPKIVAYLAQ